MVAVPSSARCIQPACPTPPVHHKECSSVNRRATSTDACDRGGCAGGCRCALPRAPVTPAAHVVAA